MLETLVLTSLWLHDKIKLVTYHHAPVPHIQDRVVWQFLYIKLLGDFFVLHENGPSNSQAYILCCVYSTAQNICLRVGCAKSALYGTKCTLESRMCKKYSIQHKMYAREWDVQKVLYTAQNVCSRVGCAKSALYSTKCMAVFVNQTLRRTFCALYGTFVYIKLSGVHVITKMVCS